MQVLADIAEFLVDKPLTIVLILAAATALNWVVRRAISRFVDRIAGSNAVSSMRGGARARAIGSVLRSLSSVVILGVAVLTVLGELGIDLGPLLATAGVAGIALGFGAQTLVRDLLSGAAMLIEDQCGVGDIVDVGEATGIVEAVSLRAIRLRDVNGTVWHVPNGEIRRVGNQSQQWARALLDVSVAYGTDIRHAQLVIKQAADAMWDEEEWSTKILEAPEVWGVESLGIDGIDIRLVVKTQPAAQFQVKRELRIRLKEALDAEGIEIPFPQRSLWFRRDQDAPPVPTPGGSTSESEPA